MQWLEIVVNYRCVELVSQFTPSVVVPLLGRLREICERYLFKTLDSLVNLTNHAEVQTVTLIQKAQ